MNNIFEVKTRNYSGPLEKLLELIEEKKLEITSVNIAEVTGDFISYVRGLEGKIEHRTLADFLVIAARLILIKSKVLLPSLELTEEEEGDIRDLEARLVIYREYKAAGELVRKLWNRKKIVYSRPLFLGLGETSVFYP